MGLTSPALKPQTILLAPAALHAASHNSQLCVAQFMKPEDFLKPVGEPEPAKETPHVDDWVANMGFEDKPEDGDAMYARWLMMHWRLPAYMKGNFAPFIAGRKLFCDYEGKRYRCIGGSRMGDVWLTTNFEAEYGYEKRVDVSNCSQWSETALRSAASDQTEPTAHRHESPSGTTKEKQP